jgi:phosphoglucomutase
MGISALAKRRCGGMIAGTMTDAVEQLKQKIDGIVNRGQLRADAAANIEKILAGNTSDFYVRVLAELVEDEDWTELNDRFYKTLAFGTGGLRGRTIGKIVTAAERGTLTALGRPQFPCVGTNAMNYFNVSRATQGLIAYVKKWRAREEAISSSDSGAAIRRSKIVIAHDTRHFSKEFAELAAKVAAESGCEAVIFDGPRSTPELSFAVRYLQADAGIVITASHNPPYDNGYKVYFNDGAQVVEPHASGIIAEVNAIVGESPATGIAHGNIITAGDAVDRAYMDRLETLVLDHKLIAGQQDLKIIYTPIHGTGGVIIKPMLSKLGFTFSLVPEQEEFDGRFPTVKSPNPENAAALQLGIEQAKRENADVVIATDPDCDRMGVAARTGVDGEMKLLTGNQIGSLMAWYRAKTFFDRGILNKQNAARGVIIKTFVTTDLQKAIAAKFGLRCVETLTGFKYIGEKLKKYESALAPGRDYRQLPEEETRRLRLERSSFYVFGGEESYGYSGADFVRDKDGNGAVVMFCEVAAYAKSRGLTLDALLDTIYAEFGYFEEKTGSLFFEGSEGAEKIQRLLASYDAVPPREILGRAVASVRNFEKEEIRDVEGDLIPKEKMLIFELADKTRIAVRGSGTEPKIKYYLFAQRAPRPGDQLSPEDLARAKTEVSADLAALWEWLQRDAEQRLAK